MDVRLFVVISALFCVSNCLWYPQIGSIQVLGDYGLAPTVNVSITLAVTESGLTVLNEIETFVYITCNGQSIGSSFLGSYSNMTGCLNPFIINQIDITAPNGTIIFTGQFPIGSPGQYYLLHLFWNSTQQVGVTMKTIDVNYGCLWLIIPTQGISLKAIVINPLYLICPIPYFPPQWNPVVGGLVKFDTLSFIYPGSKIGIGVEKNVSFPLAPYWVSARVATNQTNIYINDLVIINGLFAANDTYQCFFTDSQNSVSVTMNQNNGASCTLPDNVFIGGSNVSLLIKDSHMKTVLSTNGQVSFIFQDSSSSSFIWTIVTTVGFAILGFVLGGLIFGAVGYYVGKSKHHYQQIS